MSERIQGTVTFFDEIKAYGFIEKDGGGKVFVHYSAIEGSGIRTLKAGDRVEFNLTTGQKGPAASEVKKI